MKRLLCLMLCILLLPVMALADVIKIEDESGLPADWASKELLRATMIDTDRSDAMLIECGGEAMLLDGGSGQYRDRVYEMLDARGITELKYLLSSHSDNDHIHGLIYLMQSGKYEVGGFCPSMIPASGIRRGIISRR